MHRLMTHSIQFDALVSQASLVGDITTRPDTHLYKSALELAEGRPDLSALLHLTVRVVACLEPLGNCFEIR